MHNIPKGVSSIALVIYGVSFLASIVFLVLFMLPYASPFILNTSFFSKFYSDFTASEIEVYFIRSLSSVILLTFVGCVSLAISKRFGRA